jgi:hypothetical protein
MNELSLSPSITHGDLRGSYKSSFQLNMRMNKFISYFYSSNQTRGEINSSLTSEMIHDPLTLGSTKHTYVYYLLHSKKYTQLPKSMSKNCQLICFI